MKKILLFLIFVSISASTLGQTPDGVLGVKFGESKERVKSVMTDKFLIPDNTRSTDEVLIYLGGIFAGEKVQSTAFFFYENKLQQIMILLKTDSSIVFDNIKTAFTNKYKLDPAIVDDVCIWSFGKSTTVILANNKDNGIVVSYKDNTLDLERINKIAIDL